MPTINYSDEINVQNENFSRSDGPGVEKYVGQTFEALSGYAQGLKVYLGWRPVYMRLLVVELEPSGSNLKATDVIFESVTFQSPSTQTLPLEDYYFALGGLDLVAGQDYAFVLDAYVEASKNVQIDSAQVGLSNFFGPDAYPQGSMIEINLGPFPSGTREQHFSSGFVVGSTKTDLAFSMGFSGEITDGFVGTAASDTVFGGNTSANINVRAGDDTVMAGGRHDVIRGGDGNDSLNGNGGQDRLLGNHGDDNLNGGRGSDTLYGGLGNDTLRGNQGDDNLNGGDGNDLLFGDGGNDLIFGDSGQDNIYGGVGNDSLSGGGWKDYLRGGKGNDTLEGGFGDDDLRGKNGKDILNGGGGSDDLKGGGGRDVLIGEEDNDTLDGESGNDTLIGGGGSDTFVFARDFGRDTVADFDPNLDGIRLTGPGEARTCNEFLAALVQDGTDVVYDFHDDGSNVIVFNDTKVSDFTKSVRDQGQIFSTGGDVFLGTDMFTQSITASVSGLLSSIQVQYDLSEKIQPVRFSIYQGGNPVIGPSLYSEVIRSPTLDNSGVFEWSFAKAGLGLEAGDEFTFGFQALKNGVAFAASDPPDYLGGELFQNGVLSPQAGDVAFITYVETCAFEFV